MAWPCHFRKEPILTDLCRGKTVLNLGCVNHTVEAISLPNFQHAQLARVAKRIVGIDYERAGVEELVKSGFDVRYADAQNFDLTDEFPEKFQVVVASEIIEHLSNVGNFLDCITKHLTPDGFLILTTPHAYGIAFFMEVLVFGEERINDDHTATFSKKNIELLLRRHGLTPVDFFWLTQDSSKLHIHQTLLLRCAAKLFFWAQLPFAAVRQAFSKEMIFVAKLAESPSS
jgi:SAM-dependent methyltransferase